MRRRGSTIHTPPGSSLETCSTSAPTSSITTSSGGGHGRRRVDHEEVAGSELVGQLGEPGVERQAIAARHEQADVVAGAAAGFGRFVGLVGGVEAERQGEWLRQARRGRVDGVEQVEHHPTSLAE